jgi:hypothetical protein
MFGFIGSSFITAQTDSLEPRKNGPIILASSANALFTLGTLSVLSSVWYSDFHQSSFHLFDDSREWMQMDKMGHIYAAQHLSELSSNSFEWAGIGPRKSALIGSAVGWGFQFGFELLDGRSKGWGFSFSDIAANTLGSGMFLAQELAWKRQLIRIKYSFQSSPYSGYRPNTLGSNFKEELLKDYNGQTYWFSFSPFEFIETSRNLKWINLSLGYSVDQKLSGMSNIYLLEGQVFSAQRQFFLSLDINPEQMNIKSRWLKMVLRPLNWVKIPFPSLEMNASGLKFRPLYF